ncbi:hypothetical protein QQF64_032328 [Cirrhinus molitorella]|uniref:Secreted protein n=1 Tax=Cirrhinus molitorella TaxID=172907 RepID=A0ABR3MZI4_9TELE
MSISLSVSGRAVHWLMAVNGARRGLAGQRKRLWSALHERQILPASSSQRHNRNHTSKPALCRAHAWLPQTHLLKDSTVNFLNVNVFKTCF